MVVLRSILVYRQKASFYQKTLRITKVIIRRNIDYSFNNKIHDTYI